MLRFMMLAVCFGAAALLGCSNTDNNESNNGTNSDSGNSSGGEVQYSWHGMAFPCVPGKEAEAKAWIKSLCDPASEDGKKVRALAAATGMRGEFMSWQESPAEGVPSMCCVWQHTTPEHAKLMVESDDPYAAELLAKIAEMTGMDLKAMLEDPDHKPNELLGYRETGESMDGAQHNVMAVPIKEGETDAWVAAVKVLMSDEKADDWTASRKGLGMVAEGVCLQRTPSGDFAVVYHCTTADPAGIVKAMWESTGEFDVWFKENVLVHHPGMDAGGPAPEIPANEYLGSWWTD